MAGDQRQFARSTPSVTTTDKPYGLVIASLIMAVWAISLVLLLRVDWHTQPVVWIIPAVLWQTFLYTGLFITAHDAMHDCVAPQCLQLNHIIGRLALLLYGYLPYHKLRTAHWQHHQNPASDRDPDFHHDKKAHRLLWYVRFMTRYWGWRQCLGITATYHLMHQVLQVAEPNLVLFWAVPSLLSSWQLFYFGTFLVHREPANGYQNIFRANSTYRPYVWSFVTCYHFGYHAEHHEYPDVPWWQLPTITNRT
ncbi:beta-carotene ketolase CrtW [Stenomitos frigidus]|uniref:Beta-carotene ketolase n=2 Tax=Stenomitos TaxID=1844270 RepID=A0A2T1E188_9CYAN|nr:fatty acid desaturase [Stenomitos frigidus]PSB26480.1 beta-carotene ketolase [Stenomitos frigidus ULC18]